MDVIPRDFFSEKKKSPKNCYKDTTPHMYIIVENRPGTEFETYICENSYSLVQYITKYVTKADKSHLSKDDFGISDSMISKLWKYAFISLKTRELGAYEACDRWFLDDLYKCSEKFTFVSTVFPKNRSRMLKPFKDLEHADSKSTDIFNM